MSPPLLREVIDGGSDSFLCFFDLHNRSVVSLAVLTLSNSKKQEAVELKIESEKNTQQKNEARHIGGKKILCANFKCQPCNSKHVQFVKLILQNE